MNPQTSEEQAEAVVNAMKTMEGLRYGVAGAMVVQNTALQILPAALSKLNDLEARLREAQEELQSEKALTENAWWVEYDNGRLGKLAAGTRDATLAMHLDVVLHNSRAAVRRLKEERDRSEAEVEVLRLRVRTAGGNLHVLASLIGTL